MDFKGIVTSECVKCGEKSGPRLWKSERRVWALATLSTRNPKTGRPLLATFAVHSDCQDALAKQDALDALLREKFDAFVASGGDLTPTGQV